MVQKKPRFFLDFLLIFNLFLFSNASAFVSIFWLSPDYVIFEFVIWLVLVTITIWMMKKNNLLSSFFDTLKRSWFIFPFVIFSGFSVIWSVYWEISIYRWLILLFTIIAGGYIGLKYDLKKIIELLSVFGIFILLSAAAFIIFKPNIGIMNYYTIQGAWKGLYWHKNHMGLIATFINILFLINTIYAVQSKQKKESLLWSILYLLAFIFVIQSDSVAAYLTIVILHGVILLALLLLKYGRNLQRSHYLLFFAVLILASIILFSNMESLFGIFNRNTTLTGRIPMWTFLFENYLSKQPLIGYGFNAFWYIDTHKVIVQQAAGYPDPIIIADNGFIDILINTGYVGLFLFLLFYFGIWWRSIALAIKAKDIIRVFPLILMFYTLVANISWSLIFENEGFFMLSMISVLFSITSNNSISHRTIE